MARGELLAVSSNIATEHLKHYQNVLQLGDELLQMAMPVPIGRVRRREEVIDDKRFVATSIYRDWYVPNDMHHLSSAMLSGWARGGMSIAIYRPRGARPYEDRTLETFSRLVPHIQKALQIRTIVDRHEMLSAGAFEALDHLPHAVFLLGRGGEVIHCNSIAVARLTRAVLPVTVEKGRLVAAPHPAGIAAGECLAAFVRSRPARPLLRRLGAAEPADGFVLCLPLQGLRRERLALDAGDPAALVVISDGPIDPAVTMNVLARLYGLTAAEARVALALAQGHSVDEISAMLDIQADSVRTMLKRAYTKTGAGSQAQLVALLLGGPAAFLHDAVETA